MAIDITGVGHVVLKVRDRERSARFYRDGLELDVDAVADTESLIDASCAETQWRIDQLESRVLELKARSWAARLRKGESMSGEDDFPGSAISNPELKQTLYDRINAWYAEKEVPGLTLDEQEQLRQAERQARILSHRCRI